MISSCLCSINKKTSFKKFISYKNESVFKEFEGTILGKCVNCGVLKTFPSKSANKFEPKQSRGDYYDSSEEKFRKLFKPIVGLIKKHIVDNNILDVGCSSGILLTLLKKEGFKVTGVEPNKEAYEKVKRRLGKNVFQGTFKEFLKINRNTFDGIIYNHVLEHIKDPIVEINLAKKVLKPQGCLIIGTPNTRNVIFYLRQKYWEPLMPNEHIWHFNDIYLQSFFKKFNLKLTEKIFSDDERIDYPLLKRIYFKTLSLINKLFNTGEAVLMVFKKINY